MKDEGHLKRLWRKPLWLRRLLKQAYGGLLPSDWRWADHWASWRLGCREIFICQPYELDGNDLRQLVSLCDRHALDCAILGESEHYPGRTLSVWLWPASVKPHGCKGA